MRTWLFRPDLIMSNLFKLNTQSHVIFEDYYAALGLLSYAEGESALRAYQPCCILLMTHSTLLEAFSFLIKNAYIFSCYPHVAIVGPSFLKRIVEGIGNKATVFIDIDEILTVLSETRSLSSYIQKRSLSKINTSTLTFCERQVLNLLLKGKAPSFIASKLKMNVKTISGQKRAAMRKYNVTSTVELVVKHRLREEIKCAGVKRARG